MTTSPARPFKEGASEAEVYGFVGWITVGVAYVLFVFWAYLPEPVLHSIGVTWYPLKHWALTLPVWVSAAVVFLFWVYESLNMMSTPPKTSLNTLEDEATRRAADLGLETAVCSCRTSIPPLMDLDIAMVNRVLYSGQT